MLNQLIGTGGCTILVVNFSLRENASKAQQELANTACVSKNTIQRIENAKYSVTLDTLYSIFEGLKMPLKKLVDFHSE